MKTNKLQFSVFIKFFHVSVSSSLFYYSIIVLIGVSSASTIRDLRQSSLIDSTKFSNSLAQLGRNLTAATTGNTELTPCTCGIFLTSQFKKGSTEQPTGNPVLMSEINQVFPCNVAGQKMCQNKCLDSVRFLFCFFF